jgi:hypothetical protein
MLPTFPLEYPVETRTVSGIPKIYDPFRRIWVKLNKEEFVRQQVLNHILTIGGVKPSFVKVEGHIKVEGKSRRFDAFIRLPNGLEVLIEFKSLDIPLNDNVIWQALQYHSVLNNARILISNGDKHLAYMKGVDGWISIHSWEELFR